MKLSDSKYFIAALFTLCLLVSFAFRTAVFEREADIIKQQTECDFIPFTVESAIMYSYAAKVAAGENIAGRDPGLPATALPVSRQMSQGLEYFLGYSYRLKNLLSGSPAQQDTTYEDNPDFTEFIRDELRLWGALVSALVFLALLYSGVSWPLALAGGLLHAVAPATVARYTGQDILRGEFALPFIVAAFALGCKVKNSKKGAASLALCALCSFGAAAFWDVTQLFFSLWGCAEIIRIICGGSTRNRNRALFTVIYLALALAAMLIPYNREHLLLLSPLLLIIWPTLIALHFQRRSNLWRRIVAAVITLLCFTALWHFISSQSGYIGNYNHFMELIKAKIACGNVKPANPGKLNFDARFLWTPALHSATWQLTNILYPYAFWLLALLTAIGCCLRPVRNAIRDKIEVLSVPLLLTAAFFAIYIYLVRYHVFAGLMICLSLPLLANCWLCAGKSRNARALILGLIFAAAILEGCYTWSLRRAYPQNFFRETANLIGWMRSSGVKGKTVLASMELSPLLKAYCKTKIILQPKFELRQTRDLVKEYIYLMFHGDPDSLARFCQKNKIDFIVYARVSCSGMHIYSYRYMANAASLSRACPACLMEKTPHKIKHFYEIAPAGKFKDCAATYRVFRFIPEEMSRKSAKLSELSEHYLRCGNIKMARHLARAAYLADPQSSKAYIVYYKSFKTIPKVKLSDFNF